MNIPGWLIPALLGLATVCATLALAGQSPRATSWRWAVAGLVLATSALVLIALAALA